MGNRGALLSKSAGKKLLFSSQENGVYFCVTKSTKSQKEESIPLLNSFFVASRRPVRTHRPVSPTIDETGSAVQIHA